MVRVGGKGSRVDMLRAWVGRRVWAIEGRRARMVDLVKGSMVVVCVVVGVVLWLSSEGLMVGCSQGEAAFHFRKCRASEQT